MSREGALMLSVTMVLLIAVLGVRHLIRGTEERFAITRRTKADLPGEKDRNLLNRADQWFRGTRAGRAVGWQLDAAKLDMRAIDFLVGNIVTFVTVRLVVERLLSSLLALPAGLFAVGCIWLYLRSRRRRRVEAFLGQLPEVARLMSNSASSGLGVLASLELVAAELEDPAGVEMGRVAQEVQLGQSLEKALKNLSDRVRSREVGVLVSTLTIQQRAGGNTVDSLREMADTLEKRKEINREVKTLMAQSVFTAYGVAAMGVVMLVLLNMLYPGVLDDMLRSIPGLIAIVVSTAMYVCGFVVVRQISKVEA